MSDGKDTCEPNPITTYGDPRCCLDGISFIERFVVAEAPPELEEVEAAIDAEPRQGWERWARLGLLAFSLGFWVVVIRAVFF